MNEQTIVKAVMASGSYTNMENQREWIEQTLDREYTLNREEAIEQEDNWLWF